MSSDIAFAILVGFLRTEKKERNWRKGLLLFNESVTFFRLFLKDILSHGVAPRIPNALRRVGRIAIEGKGRVVLSPSRRGALNLECHAAGEDHSIEQGERTISW